MTRSLHDPRSGARALPVPQIPVERSELGCGARLLVSRREGAPVTAVQVHLRGGHSLDPVGREGTAYLTGNLLDQGTERRGEEELARLLEPLGAHVQGDANGLSATVVHGRWKTLLDVVCELATSPTFPNDRFALQRGRLRDRLAVEESDPRTRAARAFRELVYGEHWLGRPVQGTSESVAGIRAADLRRFHARNWCAGRAVISVCGDVDPAAVRRHLDRRLASWERGRDPKPPPSTLPALGARVAAHRATRHQVHVYLGHLGVRRLDPDYPALVVLDHVLGTGPGFTNRISRVLRDELGLAYSVHASIHSSAGVYPGTFTAYIGTSTEHVETAVRTFLAEMRRIRDERVEEEELELAKSYLVGAFALGLERASRRASFLVSAERLGLPEGHLAELVRELSEVTADDVQRAARAHLHPEAACLAAAGPVKKSSLAKLVRASR